ncbi:carboxypeptidase N subunit 2-like [Polistes fuscatus]|uniref:carboxypeptidase N subunit 2-like n=1 Tax=Polistes fuscatus TaxID=30207 RepID=UPI001CA9D2EE|nr:carboxypeptidase N subunit 2-like [Polistes fuscatus]
MEELGILDLSNNRIVRVSRNLFLGMPLLYELNMERNQLQVIHKTGLAPLTNLCIARFSHNPLKLTHVNGRLSVFYKNHYLEELYLSNSSIYNFFDDWSSGNHNLRLLDLSHNFISNITIVCKNWRTWEDFYIKGRLSEKRIQSLSFEKCGLSDDTTLRNVVRQLGVRDTHTLIFKSFKNLFGKLKRQHLQGFRSVKSLVLSDNGLTDISNNLLLDFPELEHIDLSNNNLNLPVDIFDTTLNLRRIVLISSGIDIIPVGIFYMLKNLESLNIISNNLEKIQEGTFDQLESLTSLNLANNLLSELQSKIFYKKNLQKMITLPDNLLANLTMLSGVQLNNNGFSFLPENLFWGSSSLQYIFLNDNSLVTLPKISSVV